MKNSFLLFCFFVCFSFLSCGQDHKENTLNGVTYKMIESGKGQTAITPGSVMMFTFEMIHAKTGKRLFPEVLTSIPEPFPVNGAAKINALLDPMLIEGGIKGGDSLVLMLKASQIFAPRFPEGVDSADVINWHIRVHEVLENDKVDQYLTNVISEIQIPQIKAYAEAKGLQLEQTPEGYFILITKEGTGAVPKPGQIVQAHYTGTLLNGTKFDSSLDRGEPLEFQLGVGQVIRGWDMAFSNLKIGSKATIIIPSYLGYGSRASGPIPPASVLVFDVELLGVVNYDQVDDQKILEYFKSQKITNYKKTREGVYYVVQKAGTGPKPDSLDKVHVHYKGRLLSGEEFDNSMMRGSEPYMFTYGVGAVIKGWDSVMGNFNKGTKATIYIPSSLAYGAQQRGPVIAPNSILVFEIDVLGVQVAPK